MHSRILKVNNASLTGENVDIKLGTEPNHEKLYEAANVARSGCNFTNGTAVCVCFLTGDNTFFGKIAEATTKIERPDTLIKHEIHRLIHFMAVIAFSLGIAFFILALVKGYSWITAVSFAIAIIVANVPEGLLPQMTVALTLTAQRMLRLGVLVSNLEIIETLGAVNVICSDKTGTLTCNRMTVSHVMYNLRIHTTPITTDLPGDKFALYDTKDKTFESLQRVATLNTEAIFLEDAAAVPDVLKRKTRGDASESAIIKFVQPFRDVVEYRSKCKMLVKIPFNSSNKWMLTCTEPEGESQAERDSKPLHLMLKGAPERVWAMCSHVLQDGSLLPMTDELRATVENLNLQLGKRGERVLAFATQVRPTGPSRAGPCRSEFVCASQFPLPRSECGRAWAVCRPPKHRLLQDLPREQYPAGYVFDADANQGKGNFPLNGFTLVGFLALMDIPRATVKPAIELCNKAGIQVYMVTGDHPVTAHAIAKSLGLVTGPTFSEWEEGDYDKQKFPELKEENIFSIVVHGMEIEKFTQDDWTRVLNHKEVVFARTMPQQKQDIVKYLNAQKKVVAMTGAGVNDAPALKAANVGIAMGSGAPVAKEAGQVDHNSIGLELMSCMGLLSVATHADRWC